MQSSFFFGTVQTNARAACRPLSVSHCSEPRALRSYRCPTCPSCPYAPCPSCPCAPCAPCPCAPCPSCLCAPCPSCLSYRVRQTGEVRHREAQLQEEERLQEAWRRAEGQKAEGRRQ